MHIKQNVSLKKYSSMRLGGLASYVTHIKSQDELVEAIKWADDKQLAVIMIGNGSNIVWADVGFKGLIIVNEIIAFDAKIEQSTYDLEVGAGENWDSVVARAVEAGATGIEALSLIPGTAGATPVQNVGAYGQEIAQTLINVVAYDKQTGQFVTIDNKDCGFGYRTSRFKTIDHGRFFITKLRLRLKIGNPEPPFYSALERYLDKENIKEYTPEVIRDAVIYIRRQKMPDPKEVANNGSFFANPVVDQARFDQLQSKYPEISHWPVSGDKVKVSAAWLVEKAGFKDYHDSETGMATWSKQCLVLVNEHAAATSDLVKFKNNIVNTVEQISGIKLEEEPELLPR